MSENRQPGNQMTLACPAKLNLTLRILSRRADGFHELESLMVPVGLFDTLSFRRTSDCRISLSCRWAAGFGKLAGSGGKAGFRDATSGQELDDSLPPATQNLAYRAVERLWRESGQHHGAVVTLIKRIPAAAGLGGASSDAAHALVAANRVWELGMSPHHLASIAAELGSDVPMFLTRTPVIARGRGEQLEPTRLPQLHLVLVKPAAGLSTPDVYRELRLHECAPQGPTASDVAGHLVAGDIRRAEAGMVNDLERPARRLSLAVGETFATLASLGLRPAMSGSGDCCFAFCRSARAARRAAARLRSRGELRAYPVATL
ncbi:MAG: hypothetical protein KDB14_25875 [Planctomycetales bacterium]|nr:hypothetical protein [Planctomycetales bacterium]